MLYTECAIIINKILVKKTLVTTSFFLPRLANIICVDVQFRASGFSGLTVIPLIPHNDY